MMTTSSSSLTENSDVVIAPPPPPSAATSAPDHSTDDQVKVAAAAPATTTTTAGLTMSIGCYDASEAAVGISAFLSPFIPGFSAVLKGRYSDFIVHEVGLDGQVAELTSTTKLPPEDEEEEERRGKEEEQEDVFAADRKRKEREAAAGANDDIRDADWWNKTCAPLEAWVGKEVTEQVIRLLQPPRQQQQQQQQENDELKQPASKVAKTEPQEEVVTTTESLEMAATESATTTTTTTSATTTLPDSSTESAKNSDEDKKKEKATTTSSTTNNGHMFVLLPSLPDKQVRRQVHEWIRNNLSFCARADTQPQSQNIRIWKACYERQMPNEHNHRNNNNNNNSNRRGGGGGGNTRRSKSSPNAWPSHWSKNNKDYLHFCLYKENMDTTAAIKELARRCMPAKVRLGYAGMKDKRGITTQYCTAYRQRATHIVQVVMNNNNNTNNHVSSFASRQRGSHHNDASKGSSVLKVGNFRYSSQELSLGMLQGNRFQIALRNIQVPITTITTTTTALNGDQQQKLQNTTTNNIEKDKTESDDKNDGATTATLAGLSNHPTPLPKENSTETALRQAAHAFATHGFINYFGMQRFGKFGDTHQVGIHVLQNDYKSAIEVIMAPKQPPDRAEQARRKWQGRFDHLTVVKEAAGDGHADAPDAAVGSDAKDKPNAKARSQDMKRAKAEADCARQIQRDFGRFMTSENAILQSLIRKPLDYQRAFTCIPRNMRMMFVHAVQSLWWNHMATRRIQQHQQQQQQLLPPKSLQIMPGDLVMLAKNDAASKPPSSTVDSKSNNTTNPYTPPHIVTEDDVQHQRYTITDVVLPLMGSKSVLPQNETGTYAQELLAKHGLTLAMFNKVADREVASKGDYRKLLCVPAHVDYDIIPYHDPMEPLIQTDLMKLEGVELKCKRITATNKVEEDVEMELSYETNVAPVTTTNPSDAMSVQGDVSISEPAASTVATEAPATGTVQAPPLLAMVISFTLPPSAYATVALRELMKKPTSYDYQKDLKLDGGPTEE